MTVINLIALLFLAVMLFFYITVVQSSTVNGKLESKSKVNWINIVILLGIAAVVRLIAAKLYRGFEVDVNCFSAWSDMVFKDGISNFYKSEAFTDYPPGYMYILYVIGAIRSAFTSLANSVILIKMPAMICDILAGVFLYKLAKKRFSESAALVLTSFYLFNPAVIINSAVWGQVDSVFTLAVVLMCYFIVEKKLPYAYFIFAAGILIKPQTIIFTPILIYGIIDQVFLEKFDMKNFLKQLGLGLLAISSMFLAALPFGLEYVIKQFTETLGSYEYATVNGYNMWAMFGMNWKPQTDAFLGMSYNNWGTLSIILTVVVATALSVLNKKSKDKYFFTGAFIVFGMFMFSVRMHERYVFPALLLILVAYLYKPRKELIALFGLLTVAHFNNVAHILFYYDPANYNWESKIPVLIGLGTFLVFLYMCYIAIRYYVLQRKESETTETTQKDIVLADFKWKWEHIQKSDRGLKFTKWDWIIMLTIIIIYSGFALYDLGDHKAPQTQWETETAGTTIDLDFGDINTHITQINYFLGNYEGRKFSIQASNDLNQWVDVQQEFEMSSVFAWGSNNFDVTARYLRLTCISDKVVVREIVFKNSDGDVIRPLNADTYPELFDESDLFPERFSFRNGTYFDEIYHARTAYEYTQGLYSYENTHPPLGKIFIALGMSIFGVNPFGWRIMGTLFGIAMLPVFYLFTKRFFKETWIAAITTTLFAADFMHFAQTRIATIDVFVTFFIILMYYFMYQYTQLSFYDTKLYKTLIPLGLCGVSMGLGIACKWPGIYAAAGLAVIFFWTMFKRFMEYKIACKDPEGATDGMKHDVIIKSFKKNTILTFLFCLGFFIIIPGLIYLAAYIPFRDGWNEGIISTLIRNQQTMYNYHSKIEATHPFSSWWYQWPIMTRPIWYYSGDASDTLKEGISSFGNPLVWWTGIAAFIYMVGLVIKKQDKKALFLCVSYLAQFMPWFLVSRIVFIYHYFPSVPFVTLMIGYAMFKLSQMKEGKYKKRWIKFSIAYAAAAVVLFLMFYPVLSGQPVDQHYVLTWLRWFQGWVLISA